MIDLHAHILPEIDDGSQSLAESLLMIEQAVQQGITTIVATPHHKNGVYMNEKDQVIYYVEQLQEEIDQRGLPVTIIPSQEVHIYSEIVADIEANNLLTLDKKGKYLLLELPFTSYPTMMDRIIYEMQLCGVTPVIAHPERYRYIRENPTLLYEMVDKGALTQFTSGSLLGYFGEQTQQFSLRCIEHQLCHLMATDAHNVKKRGVTLREAYEVISAKYSQDMTALLVENASKIVEGQDMFVEEAIPFEKNKRRRFRKLKKWFNR